MISRYHHLWTNPLGECLTHNNSHPVVPHSEGLFPSPVPSLPKSCLALTRTSACLVCATETWGCWGTAAVAGLATNSSMLPSLSRTFRTRPCQTHVFERKQCQCNVSRHDLSLLKEGLQGTLRSNDNSGFSRCSVAEFGKWSTLDANSTQGQGGLGESLSAHRIQMIQMIDYKHHWLIAFKIVFDCCIAVCVNCLEVKHPDIYNI